MKARVILQPIYFEEDPSEYFIAQLDNLKHQLADLTQFARPKRIGDPDPGAADALLIVDLSSAAYGRAELLDGNDLPILIVTSEFSTVSMWDWEIRDYLADHGVSTIAPNSLEETRLVVSSLAAKKELASGKFLVYLDDLGAGKQPDIFKRFYWYTDECARVVKEQLGLEVEQRSYRGLVARSAVVTPSRVSAEMERIRAERSPSLSAAALEAAVRLYIALADDVAQADGVLAAGINCLNESESADTTPCLAFDILFERTGIVWGCESDLLSMLTAYLVSKVTDRAFAMTNLYPFAIGEAALKHEGIPGFPEVEGDPNDHILVAHCGYFGIVPKCRACTWSCELPVLEIVDPNAHAIDARMDTGDVTLVKIRGDARRLTFKPAQFVDYVQYPDSDCLNGGVLRVDNGLDYVDRLPSHHTIVVEKHLRRELDLLCSVLGLELDEL